MDNPKLLVLCPSRGRPERIMEMLKSYEATVDFDHTRLRILLDKDDKDARKYARNLPSWAEGVTYDRQYDHTHTTEIINRAFMQENDYEFYSVINDDIEFLTYGWDKSFCNKGKISTGIDDTMVRHYGKDFVSQINIEGFPILSGIDGDIARAIGYMQYPKFKHSCGDNFWYWIAKRLDCLHIDKDIHWNHKSHYFGEGEADETYKRTYVYGSNTADDYAVYIDWLKYKIHKDIEKIKHNAPHLFKKEVDSIKGERVCHTEQIYQEVKD
jgi:hypothetical protein